MRRSGMAVLSGAVMLLVLTLGARPASANGYPYPPVGWEYGSAAFMDRIGQVLGAIDSPSRRSEVAESWVQFAKTTIARNLELQQQWLDLQKQQLAQNQQASQENLEIARLHLQIQQLHAENLKLERENLQMQAQIMKQGGGQAAPRQSPAEPNETAGTGSTNSRGSRTPPAEPQ